MSDVDQIGKGHPPVQADPEYFKRVAVYCSLHHQRVGKRVLIYLSVIVDSAILDTSMLFAIYVN